MEYDAVSVPSPDSLSGYNLPTMNPLQFPGQDFFIGAAVAGGAVQQSGYLSLAHLSTEPSNSKSGVTITLEPDNNGVDLTGPGPFYISILKDAIQKGATPGTTYNLVPDSSTYTLDFRVPHNLVTKFFSGFLFFFM